MLAHERGGAEQTGFLPVGDEGNHIVRERRAGAQCAQRLQHRRRTGGVIAGGGTASDAVVVRHQHHGETAGRPPGKPGHHVAHAPGLRVARADARRLLHLRVEPERAQLRQHVLAHARVVRAARRMRPLRDLPHVGHRPLGREHSGRRGRRDRRRREGRAPNEQRAQHEQRNNGRRDAAGCGRWHGPDSTHAPRARHRGRCSPSGFPCGGAREYLR